LKIVALLVLVLVAIPVLLYLLAPGTLLRFLRDMQRRRGKLVAKTITVDGLAWPYLDGGNSAGEPVMLIHGFGGDKDNWAFYAPYLAGKYRVICPDLPGFGETVRDATLDHSAAAQADRLAAFLTALGIERCHLGGNSMGGQIALQFALEYPQRLRSLTLFNNAGAAGTEPSDLQEMLEARPGTSPLVPRSVAEMRSLMAYIVHRPRPIPARFFAVMFARMQPHIALHDRIFAGLHEDMLERPLNDRLAEVKVPTLIVWGRHDRLLHVSTAEVQHAAITGSELAILEHLGHVPMVEDPAATSAVQLPFLARH
jgi:abhydrolase domain-containing protein 6